MGLLDSLIGAATEAAMGAQRGADDKREPQRSPRHHEPRRPGCGAADRRQRPDIEAETEDYGEGKDEHEGSRRSAGRSTTASPRWEDAGGCVKAS